MARHPKHPIILHCDVCGQPTGEQIFTLQPMTEIEFRLQESWVDHRHDTCEATHGNFKEMTIEYEQKTGESAAKAEGFVMKFRKKADFDKELVKEVARIEKEKAKLYPPQT